MHQIKEHFRLWRSRDPADAVGTTRCARKFRVSCRAYNFEIHSWSLTASRRVQPLLWITKLMARRPPYACNGLVTVLQDGALVWSGLLATFGTIWLLRSYCRCAVRLAPSTRSIFIKAHAHLDAKRQMDCACLVSSVGVLSGRRVGDCEHGTVATD